VTVRPPRYSRPTQAPRSSLIPVLGLFIVALACAAILFFLPRFTPIDPGPLVFQFVDTPAGESATPVPFTVHEGESGAAIGDRLQTAGLIGSSDVFRLLVGYYGAGDKLQAGEYWLRPNMRPSQIIAELSRGEGPGRLVTIPEGRRLEEVAAILADREFFAAEEFIAAAQAGEYAFDFLAELPAGAPLEGYLFPESYRLGSKATPREAVRKMLETFDQRVDAEVRRTPAPDLTPRQVITLASIVEREAQVAAERPVIAAVYLNRLRQGIKLDADPTVQYALTADPQQVARFGWWKRDLIFADLEVNSPYNTYRRTGLPPGPIANPGLASVQAVLNPARTDYLYFVAQSDGSHLFARTLEEHNANVRRARQ
jgi:UPF0755 protein